MARLVAGFGTSHSPMLAGEQADWLNGVFGARDRARSLIDLEGNPCRFDDLLAKAPPDAPKRIAPALLARRHGEANAAMARLRDDVAVADLDALIVVGDDQEELFDHTNMPAIGIFHGAEIRNGRAAPVSDRFGVARMRFMEDSGDVAYPCNPTLALHLIERLQDDGFDLSAMSGLAADRSEGHAYSYAHKFCMGPKPIPIVPVFLNAYYPPNQPSASRCHALGQAIARAVACFPDDMRIGVMASGGLSHFVVDEALDRRILQALGDKDAEYFRTLPSRKLQSGSSEIRNWICLAGAAAALDLDWSAYVPGYRTEALTGTGFGFASLK